MRRFSRDKKPKAAAEAPKAAAEATVEAVATVEPVATVEAVAAVEAVDISDDVVTAPAAIEPKPDRLETTSIPLKFVSSKTGAGVSISEGGQSAASDGKVVGAQLADVWMAGGRNPLVWTCALILEEVTADTVIGVVGRNFFPSTWDAESPLTKSTHAVVLKCGDGSVTHKGKNTSFILRPLESGARLHMIADMQKLELTVELVGKDAMGIDKVLSSLTVEGIPSEVTLAVGFAASAASQRVRIVGCKSEKPEMVLMGKLRKDLWDDDNIQTPLPLNVKKERGELQQQQAEIAVAASLGGD